MSRSTSAVIEDHLRRAKAGDLEGDLRANYSPDVILIAAEATYHGHAGIRAAARFLEDQLPGHDYDYVTVRFENDIGFLLWTGRGGRKRVRDGADTFVVRDGSIVAQTVFFNVEAA
jgi:SnoaL-like domain